MRLPWQPSDTKIVNLATQDSRVGVSGLPPVDREGNVVDQPIGEWVKSQRGGSAGGKMFSGIKSAWNNAANMISVAQARAQSDPFISLVAPWLANLTWTISLTFIALARQAYGANPVVYACVKFLMDAVAEPPLVPYDVNTSYDKHELKFDHPLYKLLRSPNELMTTHQMVSLTVNHMAIVGRSHWWKERDRLGRVIAIWPLRPDRVGPLYAIQPVAPYTVPSSGDMSPIESTNRLLSGWNYWPPGTSKPIRIPRADVMTFLLPNPGGETGGVVEGLGPVQVLAREIEADNEATSFIAALLKNSAMPGAILHVKASMMKDRAAKFKREFKRAFSGDRRGEIAVFDGDTAYQEVGFNMQQMEFSGVRKVSESRIAACLGIPIPLVGFVLGSESASRSTIAEFRELFAETTCPSWWTLIQETITRDLASEFKDGAHIIEFDTSRVKALTIQSNREIQPFQIAFQSGAITVDEYRLNVLGLDPLPNGAGNMLYVPNTTTAVSAGGDDSHMGITLDSTDIQPTNGALSSETNQGNGLQVKPSQEHDNDPRSTNAQITRPVRGKPSVSYTTQPGTQGKSARIDLNSSDAKIVRIEEVRRHLGRRGKAWIPPIEWRSPQYIYGEEKVS